MLHRNDQLVILPLDLWFHKTQLQVSYQSFSDLVKFNGSKDAAYAVVSDF